MKSVIHKEAYHHFLCLSVAVSILLNSNHDERERLKGYAKSLLKYYVSQASKFYGEIFVVYNVHSFIHLADDVDGEISLNEINAFPFKNYLQKLKKIVRNYNNSMNLKIQENFK